MNWHGKRVLVTGANANTGFEIARRFADVGATVFLHAPTLGEARAAAAKLRTTPQMEVWPVAADFRRPARIGPMIDGIIRRADGIDILINNAVDQVIGYAMQDTPLSALRAAIAINLESLFVCTQAVVRAMIKQGGGTVVNIGSNTSERAIRQRSVYIATKGALDALTRALAVELGDHGIRVNMVVPGYIHSDRWKSLTKGVITRRRANLPLGREASATDVAEAILFLASDAARSITGARLAVDAGSLAQLLPADVETGNGLLRRPPNAQ
ncbi:MAG: SDR family oxidoreductase [Lacunisphaera sp.]|nr:SDR family oxidoreductase [Lacunisphaera sp.]